MMHDHELQKIIDHCVKFVIQSQNDNGSFDSQSSNHESLSHPQNNTTVFYSALILDSLIKSKNTKLKSVVEKGAEFLLSQKSKISTFNYWSKDMATKPDERYPDDLDDTACALAVLFRLNKLSQDDLINITKVLSSLEVREGGPYPTWINLTKNRIQTTDVDLAVNMNISYFLSLLEIEIPNINNLINKCLQKNTLHSPYYVSKNSLLFFASRFHKDKSKLTEIIEDSTNVPFQNPLECLLLGLATLNIHQNISSVRNFVEYLIEQKKNLTKSYRFVVERIYKDKTKRFSGSTVLTAALTIEFLSRILLLTSGNASSSSATRKNKQKKEVRHHCKMIFASRLSPDLYKNIDFSLDKIFEKDENGEIVIHPFLFNDSLFYQVANDRILLDLAAGSVLGWIAYTVFDNVMDENKDTDLLPLSLLCHRELERLFCHNQSSFRPIFENIMDRVDYANFFENKHLRFCPEKNYRIPKQPIYKNPNFVAEKSIAHALSSFRILYELGIKNDSQEFIKIMNFYETYLTARQLNDDAHDWEEDLCRGQINFASEIALQEFRNSKKINFLLSKDLPALREIFWRKSIVSICSIINLKLSEARQNLNDIKTVIDPRFLDTKLSQLENATRMALSEREKTLTFISKYFEIS